MQYRQCNTRTLLCACAVLAAAAAPTWAVDSQPAALTAAGNWLVNQQVPQTVGGAWTDTAPNDYTGVNVGGLVNAYRCTGTTSFKTAAQSGADYIIAHTEAGTGNYQGDNLYGLTQIAGLQADPLNNTYRQKAATWLAGLSTFNKTYNSVLYTGAGGYADYIEALGGGDASVAAIYLSYYTVAAHNVNDTARESAFRSKLINVLGKVDDVASYYPVGGLGIGVWALAQTGGLDSTPITGPATSPLAGLTLAQLPGVLHDRIDLLSYSFDAYLQSDAVYGYTEDAAFAIMGLAAAHAANPALNYTADIEACRNTLIGAVTSDGVTHLLVNGTDDLYSPATVYAGRVLEAIVPEPASLALLGIGVLGLLARRRAQR